MTSGGFVNDAFVLNLHLSDDHKKTSLQSLFEAKIFLFAGEALITMTYPGCMIMFLIFIFGCFFATS
jgi:hypothetical protein